MSEQMYNIRISVDQNTPNIAINIGPQTPDIQLEVSGTGVSVPEYEGPYHAESHLDKEVVLPTKSKIMKEDFVVDELPVYRVTNPSGGYTYFIGR